MVVRLTAGLQGEVPWPKVPQIPKPRDAANDFLTTPWSICIGDSVKVRIVDFDRTNRTILLDMTTAVAELNAARQQQLLQWQSEQAKNANSTAFSTAGTGSGTLPPTLINSDHPLLRPLPDTAPRGRLTVLLVDDMEQVIDSIKSTLQDRGHHVKSATLYTDAREIIDKEVSIDVAIIDQQLPDGQGLHLLRHVRAGFPHARLILFTAQESALEEIEWGEGIIFVRKPADPADVLAAIEGRYNGDLCNRDVHVSETVGALSQMTSEEAKASPLELRTLIDSHLAAMQEPFGNVITACFRLQRSTNEIQCLRALGINGQVFHPYRHRLRFSFIGNVLHGTMSGFFEASVNPHEEDARDCLQELMTELKTPHVYGTRLRVETQPNPMCIIVFLREHRRDYYHYDIRAFEQAANALSLALERATIDAHMFRNQRVMLAGSMLLGMGHELRNEVQAVASMADYLSRLISRNSDPSRQAKLAHGVSYIMDNSNRLRKLLHSALSMTSSVSEEPRALGEILKDTILKCRVMAAKEDVLLRLDAESEELMAHPVAGTMEQVLMNLILNAIQHVRLFQEARSGYVHVIVSRELHDQGSIIAIRVEDNAFGVNWENSSSIFEPYFTTRHDGTGLGLSVAKSITRANHGMLDIEWSYLFLGSCFLVRLPL
jgi:signal transduction histidine kinase/DNA-binding NarL/FixJ family response regulator